MIESTHFSTPRLPSSKVEAPSILTTRSFQGISSNSSDSIDRNEAFTGKSPSEKVKDFFNYVRDLLSSCLKKILPFLFKEPTTGTEEGVEERNPPSPNTIEALIFCLEGEDANVELAARILSGLPEEVQTGIKQKSLDALLASLTKRAVGVAGMAGVQADQLSRNPHFIGSKEGGVVTLGLIDHIISDTRPEGQENHPLITPYVQIAEENSILRQGIERAREGKQELANQPLEEITAEEVDEEEEITTEREARKERNTERTAAAELIRLTDVLIGFLDTEDLDSVRSMFSREDFQHFIPNEIQTPIKKAMVIALLKEYVKSSDIIELLINGQRLPEFPAGCSSTAIMGQFRQAVNGTRVCALLLNAAQEQQRA